MSSLSIRWTLLDLICADDCRRQFSDLINLKLDDDYLNSASFWNHSEPFDVIDKNIRMLDGSLGSRKIDFIFLTTEPEFNFVVQNSKLP